MVFDILVMHKLKLNFNSVSLKNRDLIFKWKMDFISNPILIILLRDET